MMVQPLSCACLVIVIDTGALSHITRHPAPISIAHNCASYLLPTITISPGAMLSSITSGVATAVQTLPLTVGLLSLPHTILPSSVSAICLYVVSDNSSRSLSYISMYDVAISVIVMIPSSLRFFTTGSVTTPISFIIFQTFFMETEDLMLSVLRICKSLTCALRSCKSGGALTPQLSSTNCVSSLSCPALYGM